MRSAAPPTKAAPKPHDCVMGIPPTQSGGFFRRPQTPLTDAHEKAFILFRFPVSKHRTRSPLVLVEQDRDRPGKVRHDDDNNRIKKLSTFFRFPVPSGRTCSPLVLVEPNRGRPNSTHDYFPPRYAKGTGHFSDQLWDHRPTLDKTDPTTVCITTTRCRLKRNFRPFQFSRLKTPHSLTTDACRAQ